MMNIINKIRRLLGLCIHEWNHDNDTVPNYRCCKICVKEQYGHATYEQWIDYN